MEEYNRKNDYDFLLVCSDGLYNRVSDEQIAKVLSSFPTIGQRGEELRKEALDAGGLDNIALVITANPEKNHE